MAVQAISAVIVNDWPRAAYHRGEILEGLTVCWCRIREEEALSTQLEMVKESIRRTVTTLTAALKESVDVEEEYKMLVDSDGRLQGLLLI